MFNAANEKFHTEKTQFYRHSRDNVSNIDSMSDYPYYGTIVTKSNYILIRDYNHGHNS